MMRVEGRNTAAATFGMYQYMLYIGTLLSCKAGNCELAKGSREQRDIHIRDIYAGPTRHACYACHAFNTLGNKHRSPITLPYELIESKQQHGKTLFTSLVVQCAMYNENETYDEKAACDVDIFEF